MKLKLKVLLTLTPLLLILYLFSPPTSTAFLSNFELDSAEFTNFLSTYNKLYTPEEKLFRLQVFKSNQALIHTHNAQTVDFKLALNKFADLTQPEFLQMQSEPPAKTSFSRNLNPENIEKNLKSIPSDWDWRDKGAVSDVVDQGKCKSSWAIATAGSVEGARVAQGLVSLLDLSSQEILDCVSFTSGHGCEGGLVDDAFVFVQANGLTSDLIYPYTGKNQTCNNNSVAMNVTTIADFYDVPADDAPSLINAIAFTPVISCIDVSGYVWQFYYSGVITQYCGTDPIHNVLLVGYSQSATPPYYIAKNSWGQDWGESGYVRIGIYGGVGICGIQSLSSYPIY